MWFIGNYFDKQMRIVLCLIFLTLNHLGYAQKSEPVRNNNPIIPDMIADPSIVKINGTWYSYATTDGYGNFPRKGLSN